MSSPVSNHTTTLYEIRDAVGTLHAIHERRDTTDGKRMAWRLPGESGYGLAGRRVDSLPLYGAQHVADWPLDAWIVLTEGESDCDALARLDVPALGTVTGAASTPTPEALGSVAMGRRFVTWPDNDDAGDQHMIWVGTNLYRAGAADVRNLIYRPTALDWPKGAGARDLVDGVDPVSGAFMVAWLIEEWSQPMARPGRLVTVQARPLQAHRDTGSVSAALVSVGILNAKPGRTVRCPAHQDRHASLSIFRDDRRAVCKSSGCPWTGSGVIARDVLEGVRP